MHGNAICREQKAGVSVLLRIYIMVYKMWTEGPAMKELRRVRAPEWMLIIDLGQVTSHAPRLGASL